ncbi:MAG TPA: SRPBCC family protein [Streptosporangiaceae bacterium]|jgi:hypothetical protein
MADRTSSAVVIMLPAAEIMSVIADFPAYPQWAGVQSAEVLATGQDGRASRVRFGLDAGVIKDRYVLGYQWDGDTQVHWDLAEPGSVISEMSGAYLLAGQGEAGTKVTFELAVGVRIPMIGMLKRRAEKIIIDTALNGLRSRAASIKGSAS